MENSDRDDLCRDGGLSVNIDISSPRMLSRDYTVIAYGADIFILGLVGQIVIVPAREYRDRLAHLYIYTGRVWKLCWRARRTE